MHPQIASLQVVVNGLSEEFDLDLGQRHFSYVLDIIQSEFGCYQWWIDFPFTKSPNSSDVDDDDGNSICTSDDAADDEFNRDDAA